MICVFFQDWEPVETLGSVIFYLMPVTVMSSKSLDFSPLRAISSYLCLHSRAVFIFCHFQLAHLSQETFVPEVASFFPYFLLALGGVENKFLE